MIVASGIYVNWRERNACVDNIGRGGEGAKKRSEKRKKKNNDSKPENTDCSFLAGL